MTVDMTISKSKFKARMLELFRRLEEEGGEIIVTDHGKETLLIRPIKMKLHEVSRRSRSRLQGWTR